MTVHLATTVEMRFFLNNVVVMARNCLISRVSSLNTPAWPCVLPNRDNQACNGDCQRNL